MQILRQMTDTEWLKTMLAKIDRRSNADEDERFTERVGIKMQSGGTESAARAQTFKLYYCEDTPCLLF